MKERHDESVNKDGGFDGAIEAIRLAQQAGFRVMTNTTFFNTDTPHDVIGVLDYLNDVVKVDNMQISPAYAYDKAPDQEHWLGVEETRELFRKAFADGRRKKWRLNHSPVFLDFLEGKRELACTAWGIPSYSLLGWQRPCYLLDDGYAATYKELIDDDRLGRVRARQGSALRELHGALRVRADGRHRDHGLAQGVAARRDRRVIACLTSISCPGRPAGAAGVGAAAAGRARSGTRLIEVVGVTGGHLGPNLGVVELTIALHRVFESPRDVIIWDTGHQAYVHKMLTGRSAALPTLRQGGGLSGYPAQAESEHDLVENSHASTSLSYLDGVAKGFALSGATGPDRGGGGRRRRADRRHVLGGAEQHRRGAGPAGA